jgi:Transposase IS4
MPADPRRVPGGTVWARAESVTHDAKRVYGALLATTWLKGTVIAHTSELRNPTSRRATSYVTASFNIGNSLYNKKLPLAVTKATLPEGAVDGNAPPTDNGNPPAANNINNNAAPPPDPPVPPLNGHVAAQAQAQAAAVLPPLEPQVIPPAIPGVQAPQVPAGPRPIYSNHGRDWFDGEVEVDVNGPVPAKYWRMKDQYHGGRTYSPGCDSNPSKWNFTPFDYFMACFPRKQLKYMVDCCSANLRADGKAVTSTGEVLKWIGVTLLMTAFEFGSRASLWEKNTDKRRCKYILSPQFGQTGMSRDRYDHITKHMKYSFQPTHCEPGMSQEAYRWMLVQDFITRFNEHRRTHYSPTKVICVDESMSRWYGLGGHWINMGLPMYVAIDRKPDNGCEIQNCCDGLTGIMMQLKLVKSAVQEALEATQQHGDMTNDEYMAIATREDENG